MAFQAYRYNRAGSEQTIYFGFDTTDPYNPRLVFSTDEAGTNRLSDDSPQVIDFLANIEQATAHDQQLILERLHDAFSDARDALPAGSSHIERGLYMTSIVNSFLESDEPLAAFLREKNLQDRFLTELRTVWAEDNSSSAVVGDVIPTEAALRGGQRNNHEYNRYFNWDPWGSETHDGQTIRSYSIRVVISDDGLDVTTFGMRDDAFNFFSRQPDIELSEASENQVLRRLVDDGGPPRDEIARAMLVTVTNYMIGPPPRSREDVVEKLKELHDQADERLRQNPDDAQAASTLFFLNCLNTQDSGGSFKGFLNPPAPATPPPSPAPEDPDPSSDETIIQRVRAVRAVLGATVATDLTQRADALTETAEDASAFNTAYRALVDSIPDTDPLHDAKIQLINLRIFANSQESEEAANAPVSEFFAFEESTEGGFEIDDTRSYTPPAAAPDAEDADAPEVTTPTLTLTGALATHLGDADITEATERAIRVLTAANPSDMYETVKAGLSAADQEALDALIYLYTPTTGTPPGLGASLTDNTAAQTAFSGATVTNFEAFQTAIREPVVVSGTPPTQAEIRVHYATHAAELIRNAVAADATRHDPQNWREVAAFLTELQAPPPGGGSATPITANAAQALFGRTDTGLLGGGIRVVTPEEIEANRGNSDITAAQVTQLRGVRDTLLRNTPPTQADVEQVLQQIEAYETGSADRMDALAASYWDSTQTSRARTARRNSLPTSRVITPPRPESEDVNDRSDLNNINWDRFLSDGTYRRQVFDTLRQNLDMAARVLTNLAQNPSTPEWLRSVAGAMAGLVGTFRQAAGPIIDSLEAALGSGTVSRTPPDDNNPNTTPDEQIAIVNLQSVIQTLRASPVDGDADETAIHNAEEVIRLIQTDASVNLGSDFARATSAVRPENISEFAATINSAFSGAGTAQEKAEAVLRLIPQAPAAPAEPAPAAPPVAPGGGQ